MVCVSTPVPMRLLLLGSSVCLKLAPMIAEVSPRLNSLCARAKYCMASEDKLSQRVK